MTVIRDLETKSVCKSLKQNLLDQALFRPTSVKVARANKQFVLTD
jgi:hypothetical protein